MSKFGALPRDTRISLLVGAFIALLILITGSVVALGHKTSYTAESIVVMLPRTDLDASASASYYEVLSRGQIIATFAEVANNHRFEQQVEADLLLPDDQRATATIAVSVIPSTSVIMVRASAEDPAIAERMADGTTALVTEYMSGLSQPYRTDIVQSAGGSAYRSSTAPALLWGLPAAVALIAGLATQQAVYHLLLAVRRGPKREEKVVTSSRRKVAVPTADELLSEQREMTSWR